MLTVLAMFYTISPPFFPLAGFLFSAHSVSQNLATLMDLKNKNKKKETKKMSRQQVSHHPQVQTSDLDAEVQNQSDRPHM